MFCRRWFLVVVSLASLNVSPARAFGQQSSTPAGSIEPSPPAAKPEWTEIPIQPKETPVSPSTPGLPEIRFPNFASCSLAELQLAVSELSRLKPTEDQSKLRSLLEKTGAKTAEIARRTPNLISHEAVVLKQGDATMRQDFSFLVLQHLLDPKSAVFDEYRVDLKTGEKIETDFQNIEAPNSRQPSSAVELPKTGASVPQPRARTLSQGFVNQWLYFYPPSQPESEFRYLGEQTIDGHRTLVVAFAQKPGSVRMPVTFITENGTFPVFMQGVAWVDSSDFRIVQLRTDLLLPPPGMQLRRLTVDIRFSEIRLAEVPSPLWLPRQVIITANVGAVALHEKHTYTDYRLFRTHSKIVSR